MLPTKYLALKQHAKKRVEPWDDSLVDRAFELASIGHRNQFRQSGKSYIHHPLAVARIVADLHCDLPTFLAAILHDVVEDTTIDLKELSTKFGSELSFIVDAVTKISDRDKDQPALSKKAHAESLKKILVGTAKDLRVAYIKLADRLHNLRTLGVCPPEERTQTIEDTRVYFGPLARELGIGYLHRELVHWAFRFGNQEEYAKINATASAFSESYRRRINNTWNKLDSKLHAAGITGKRVEIPLAVNLIQREACVQTQSCHDIEKEWSLPYELTLVFHAVDDCYTALGIIHSLWTAVSSQFGDWMANPLPDGYRAIHTTVQTEKNEIVILRLKTEEMHQHSEWGPLFHLCRVFNYEEAYQCSPQASLLRRIIDLDKTVVSTDRFLEYLCTEVLQPKTRIFLEEGFTHVPIGATVLDLAYSRAPSVGHRCRGAVVNGKEVRVDCVLHTGDVVTLKTGDIAEPDPAWEFGKTYMTATAKYAILSSLHKG